MQKIKQMNNRLDVLEQGNGEQVDFEYDLSCFSVGELDIMAGAFEDDGVTIIWSELTEEIINKLKQQCDDAGVSWKNS